MFSSIEFIFNIFKTMINVVISGGWAAKIESPKFAFDTLANNKRIKQNKLKKRNRF